MRKALILTVLAAVCFFAVSCGKEDRGMGETDAEQLNSLNSEFTLYSENGNVALNSNISELQMTPIKVKDGAGDGFHWKEYEYYDIKIKALMTDEREEGNIIKFSTSSSDYKTAKGIKF